MSQYLIAAEAGLALVDPFAYPTFVGEHWTPPQLRDHYLQQMQQQRILLWGTGAPGRWRVEVSLRWSDERGFREMQGSITATGNRLLFADYELFSRLAEFPNQKVADEEPGDMTLSLRPGSYRCRVVQLYDPADAERAADR